MIGKFLLAAGWFLLYMVLLGVGGALISQFSDSKGLLFGFLIAGTAGMVPIMMLIGRKVLAFKADPGVLPLDRESLLERLRDFEVEGCPFSVEEKEEFIVIVPPALNYESVQGLRKTSVEETFFVKIWLDEEVHDVRLKDVVTTRAEMVGAGEYYFHIQGQSGFVTSSTLIMDSDGNVSKLGNGKLRRELIKMLNESGWNVSFKIF